MACVATGYDNGGFRSPRTGRPGISDRAEPPRSVLREPGGEPRVRRVRERTALELDVPEFIPRR